MSRVRDVEVRGGGVVEGQVWAGGAEGHVAGVEMAEPGPGLVGSVDCRAFANPVSYTHLTLPTTYHV